MTTRPYNIGTRRKVFIVLLVLLVVPSVAAAGHTHWNRRHTPPSPPSPKWIAQGRQQDKRSTSNSKNYPRIKARVKTLDVPKSTTEQTTTKRPIPLWKWKILHAVGVAEILTLTSEYWARFLLKKHHVSLREPLTKVCPLVPLATLFWINTVVFCAWIVSIFNRKLLFWMARHFVLPADPLERASRPWTFLTHAFSHALPQHFLANMSNFLYFGRVVSDAGSYRKFIYFYIASVHASLLGERYIFYPIANTLWYGRLETKMYAIRFAIHRLWARHVRRKRIITPTFKVDSNGVVEGSKRGKHISLVGASGACCGVIPWFVVLVYNERRSMGKHQECKRIIINSCISVAMEFLMLNSNTIGHGFHLGGVLFGSVVCLSRWLSRRVALSFRKVPDLVVASNPPAVMQAILRVWVTKELFTDLTMLE